MHTYLTWARLPTLVLALACTAVTVRPAVAAAPVPAKAAASQGTFTREQLDQMLAPVALYPDALLAQVLMASSYPGDVTDAVAWSKAHPDAKGEDAVRQVANQAWDPSVQSLVAFPQLLAVLGQDPAWVQKMGDAFLAQPDAVMDSVQRLRRQAQTAGHLDSNEQQKVSTQPAASSAPQTIVIESADPQVVYVPSYNPSVVYGSWAYPAYPPYYYPPPPYYYPGGALLSFGIGVAVGGALWGDLDWGHGDIDIDVDRYNEFNSNRQINRDDSRWKHNAANRAGVPYRDGATRERFDGARDSAAQRQDYRGRDDARVAERDRARQSMERRGFDTPATTNREARDRAGASQRELGQRPAQGRNPSGSNQFRNQGGAGHGRPPGSHPENAFNGARNPGQSLGDADRGHRSVQSSQRPAGARPQGRPMNRPAAPRGGGGGGRRR